MKIGVDLSAWNSGSDFVKAKKEGLSFVILKAGSGFTYTDPKFEATYKAVKSAGIPVGAYWYLYAMNVVQAEREADLFLQRLKGKTFEYPVWLDFEDSTQAKLSSTLKAQMALAFMTKIEKAGYYTGLYSMGSWLRNTFDKNVKVGGRTIASFDEWTAHWTYDKNKKGSTVPAAAGIWQYSDKGSFTGIGKAGTGLDLNVAYKDYPSIMNKNGLNGFSKQPAPEVKPPTNIIPVGRKYVTYNNSVDKVQAERLHSHLGFIPVDLNSPNDLQESDYIVHVGDGGSKCADLVIKGGNRLDTDGKVTNYINSNK